MSTSDAVFHRRNKQIQDAIDGQNLKQALQLIEKRMKKGENSRFLDVWKAHILFCHADEAHHQRGVTETLNLCKAEPPATDLDTLDILNETLQMMGDQADTVRTLWEKASKAKPKDLDLQMRWFNLSFENDDWKSAQKAAMTLQNNFPKNRKYHIWAIFLSYLVSADAASSEMDRKLFGTLAYRMVSKAADSVPADPKELLSPPRAIQTPEELLLLVKIFEHQGCYGEVVKILDSENLGLNSRVVQNEWSFVGTKLFNLEKAQMWTEALAYTRSLLAIPNNDSERKILQERDDWAVWQILIAAARNINTKETTAETQKFLDAFIKSEPKSRNAQLARLDFTHSEFTSGNLKPEDLLLACQAYFDNNKNKLYCFGDLVTYLSALEKNHVSQFVAYASSMAQKDASAQDGATSNVATINALKLEYCFQLSADESNATKEKVEGFVSRCLETYRSYERPAPSDGQTTIESQPTDDLCLLAAMGLIRFSGTWIPGNEEQVPDTVLIRAAAILDRLLADSPHNYHALLLLVRIYLRLGAGSLALKTFSRLSVKQVQFETVAHNLFTRLATIHPHSAPPIEGAEYKDFNPQSAFNQALYFYRTADITSSRNRSNGLDYGSYVNVEGTIALQKRLKHSICRRMYALDVKRMQRLVGGDPTSKYDDIARDTSHLIDERAFDAFMNCEAPGQSTLEERVRLGPLPKERWVKSSRAIDQLFDLLRSLAAQKPVSAEIDVPNLDELVGGDAASEMTTPEIEGAKTSLNLLKVTSYIAGSKSVSSAQVDSSLAEVEDWLNAQAKGLAMDDNKVSPVLSRTAITLESGTPSAPSWNYFHYSFVALELLKAISAVCTVALRKGTKMPKLPKDQMQRLENSLRRVHEGIRSNARVLKSQSGLLGSLVDLITTGPSSSSDSQPLQVALNKTLDTAALEIFCGDLLESWEEGLDGLLKVAL